MVKLLLAVLAASVSIALSQRELPKDYQFKCQPKEGSGPLGVYEDWSKLNGEDYAKMLKSDSLRKAAELVNTSLDNLKKVWQNDAYKKLLDYTCSKAYLDLDFYVENAIAFYQFLLKGFQASPPIVIPDSENEKDFKKLAEQLFSKERENKIADIKDIHAKSDKSVNESDTAIDSGDFNELADAFYQVPELYEFGNEISSLLGKAAEEFSPFTVYYAVTFWKLSGNATVNPGGGGSGNNSTDNPNSGSTFSLSVPIIFYGLCAFNIAATLQLLPFKIF